MIMNGYLKKSIEIYNKMSLIADAAGFILADLKLEFGRLNGKITLGDSIGPDEYRYGQNPLMLREKFRKHLINNFSVTGLTEYGYQKQFENSRAIGQETCCPCNS